MSRAFVGVAAVALFAGALLADDTKSGKDSKKGAREKEIVATVVKVDANKKMLTVKTKEGAQEEFTLGKETVIRDARGGELTKGLKGVKAGTEVRLTMDTDGETVKEVRLAARASGAPPAAPGASRVRQLRRQEQGIDSSIGTVANVDADKHTLVVHLKGKDGKEEEKTIELTKGGTKLVGVRGELKLADLRKGSSVEVMEKDGKVIEVLLVTGPAKAQKQPKQTTLDGSWTMVKAEEDGKPLPDEVVHNARLTIDGNKHVVKVGQDTIIGTHRLDPNAKPHTIDATDTEGPYKGKTMFGIYRLSGDEFTVCFALPEKERPTKFTTKSGTGHLLHVWKRAKE